MFSSSELFPSIVLKLDGLPWDVRNEEILTALHPYTPIGQPQRLHIPMDMATGKTIPIAYVEIGTMEQAQACLRHLDLKRPILHGKMPRCSLSSHKELNEMIYPNGTLVRDDVIKILSVCRNYKRQYNRRCPDRPFDFVVSLIQLFPFDSIQEATQRDQIFEFHKNTVELLRIFTMKDFSYFRDNLLQDLVICGVLCPGYTLKQREVLVRCSQIEIPEDFMCFLTDEETTGQVVKRLKRRCEVPLLGTFSGFGHALKVSPKDDSLSEPSQKDTIPRMEWSPTSNRNKSYSDSQLLIDMHQDIKNLTQLVSENQSRISQLESAMQDVISTTISSQAPQDYSGMQMICDQMEAMKCDLMYKVNHLFTKISSLEAKIDVSYQ
eukprot:NODE_2_length_91304_cov_0.692462.p23 type:complete len:379 gc:universal NODE_2_length_91304_cov_0.692462:56579-55443(-)